MIVSQQIVDKHGINCKDSGVPDADVYYFLANFEADAGSSILVVGCQQERSANMLAESGFRVSGIDLSPYNPDFGPCLYNHVTEDFCTSHLMPESFDHFVSLSTIEHFGLDCTQYGFTLKNKYYDVIAMRKVYEALKIGGQAWITVPFAGYYSEEETWRVYDVKSMLSRLVQNFTLKGGVLFTSGKCKIMGKHRDVGEILTQQEADLYSGDPPHVTLLLHLLKEK